MGGAGEREEGCVMQELIARLEAATGADRVLDGDIWRAVNGWNEKDGIRFEDAPLAIWYRRDPEDSVAYEGPPDFTASIDAALTLVPAGCSWILDSDAGTTVARCRRPEWGTWAKRRQARANFVGATPAIALCIAALYAIAAAPATES